MRIDKDDGSFRTKIINEIKLDAQKTVQLNKLITENYLSEVLSWKLCCIMLRPTERLNCQIFGTKNVKGV